MTTFSIIGFGNIGQRHAQHIIANPNAKLISVCDINGHKAKEVPDDIVFHTDEDLFFNTTVADVICICTPNYLHLPHTLKSLASGHHVIVEKPMAMSVQECDQMIDAGKKTGKTIFAVKQNRYNPPVQIVKELIRNHHLGSILKVQVNCFWNRNDNYYAQSEWRGKKQQDGGLLFTQFSHFIDILYYLIGDIDTISGVMTNRTHRHNTEFEDTASFILTNKANTIIDFNCTTAAYLTNREGSITLFGEKGVIKIGGQYLNTIEYAEIEGISVPAVNISARENDYGTYKGSMSNHDKVIQNVVDVLENNHEIMTTAEDGRAVISIIEDMYAHAVILP